MKTPTARNNGETPSVMLAADIGSDALAAVSLAVAIAASAQARLRGLFVEDEDLLQVSGLPCSREITLTSARERPTSSDQMLRALRSVAQRFERTLEREALAGRIGWSFDCERGRLRDIGLRAQDQATYTILGRSMAQRLKPAARSRVQKVLLLGKKSPRLLHLVELLIARTQGGKIEFTLEATEYTEALSTQVETLAADSAHSVSIVEVERPRLLEQLDAFQRAFDLAVIARHNGDEQLPQILARLQCPVVLVA